jgi:hypothetical protein
LAEIAAAVRQFRRIARFDLRHARCLGQERRRGEEAGIAGHGEALGLGLENRHQRDRQDRHGDHHLQQGEPPAASSYARLMPA